jgi:hypothetical protein
MEELDDPAPPIVKEDGKSHDKEEEHGSEGQEQAKP